MQTPVRAAAVLTPEGLMPRTDVEARCARCVMAGSPAFLGLDAAGACKWCRRFAEEWPKYQFTPEQEQANLAAMAKEVRARRGSSQYDAVIGLSGGVDSSYVALTCKRLGLKVLGVHFDNGWNSRTAVENIRRIVDVCGMDLQTYVIDWPEFRDLQRSYLRAGVLDIEALTDHAITAAMFRIARENDLHTVLSGSNYATEHGMPEGWIWPKQDWRNIKAIHRRYGERPLRTFPRLGSLRYAFIEAFRLGGRVIWPLEMFNYRKLEAMRQLQAEFGWEYYGGKHYESTFTKFYQAYILPVKFGIDKRLVHYSALVRDGEMAREQALAEVSKPLYEADELARDKRFVLKKLGFGEEEFDQMMAQPPRDHLDFPSDQPLMRVLVRIGRPIKRALVG